MVIVGTHVMWCRGEAYVHTRSTRSEDAPDEPFDDDDNMGRLEDCDNTDEQAKAEEIVISQPLRQGESYGSRALTQKFIFSSTLSCGAGVCEVLFLSRSRFRRTLRFHMSDEDFARAFPPTNPTLYGARGGDSRDSSVIVGKTGGVSREIVPRKRQSTINSKHPDRKKNHSQIRAGVCMICLAICVMFPTHH